MKYLVVHCKHDGCFKFPYIEDEENNTRIIPVVINPPKIFFFESKDQASDFFSSYITDVDVVDPRCRLGDDIKHLEYCTCGIVDLDEDGQPILFYNKNNQIFLLELGAQLFTTSQYLSREINNYNTTNKLIKKIKNLEVEQMKKYIELGEMCKVCMSEETNDK